MTQFAWGAAGDIGQVRQVNQDHIIAIEGLFAVADGMGGHRGGEVASEVAIDALVQHFTEPTTDALVEAVQTANEAVVSRAREDAELRGMGTTMCALARVELEGEECLTVVNVGDSRAYLLKSDEDSLWQISEDHSLVQTLVRQGQLTHDEAAVHPQRNILTRALGIDQKVLVDSFDLLPVQGDRYLLCSDGLFNEVEEPEIARTMREIADPQEAAEALVRMANEGGGRDNISVVIVDIVDDSGKHEMLREKSDDHRVVHVVHGPERLGGAPEEGTIEDQIRANLKGDGARPRVIKAQGAAAAAAAAEKSRFTWRVAAFFFALVAIAGVAYGIVTWMGTNTYYVGIDNSEVAIFQGRPGGVLWIEPTVAERTGIREAQVPPEFLADVQRGKDEATLQDAERYVENMRQKVLAAEAARAGEGGSGGDTGGGIGGLLPPATANAPTTTAPTPTITVR